MHALTCEVLQQDSIAYAMIPTYYDASKYIAAKVYIEYAWHSESCIFYHCIVTELLDNIEVLMQILPTCQLRSIDRKTGKVALRHPEFKQFSMTNTAMLTDLQIWQKDYVLDIPAPFVVSDIVKLKQLQKNIMSYFALMLQNISKHAI